MTISTRPPSTRSTTPPFSPSSASVPPPNELAARETAGARAGGLLRVLGAGFGIAVLVGSSIGMGILRTPGEVARHLPSVPLFLGVWVVAGAYALVCTLTLAELGAMRPRSGGPYPIVHDALGPFPGFVTGWADWFVTAGSAAAISMVLAQYVGPLIPVLAGHERMTASVVVVGLALLQLRGIRLGDVVQQGTSLVKGVALIALALVALAMSGDAGPVTTPPPPTSIPAGTSLAVALVLALQSAIYTYDGWTGPLYFGEEVKNPGRDIPRSMVGGVVVVLAIYLMLNVAFLRIIPIAEMAGDPFVAATAARRLFGPLGDSVLRVIVVLSMVAAVNANILIYSRIPYAMSRDALLPPVVAQVNTGGTPGVSLVLGTSLSLAFIVSNSFDAVLAILAFFMIATYGLALAAFFKLRWREPDAPRPFRVPGYPIVPGLALVGAAGFLVAASVGDPRNSAWAIGLVALSWPVFVIVRTRLVRPATP